MKMKLSWLVWKGNRCSEFEGVSFGNELPWFVTRPPPPPGPRKEVDSQILADMQKKKKTYVPKLIFTYILLFITFIPF